MKLLKLVFAGALALGIASTGALANADKGQKLFVKNLKEECGVTGAKIAGKHTQAQWEKIGNGAGLDAEIKKLCPKATDINSKFLEHYYDFFYKFASDSGNVPSC
ncbi:MAG: cytochrome C [Arcobacter sp.]|nr:cytochrome C [Arcobacter sp.]